MSSHSRRRQAVLRKTLLSTLGAVSVAILLFPGCGKKEDTYTAGTFTAVYNQTLKTACIECHVPSGAATNLGVGLDFTSAATAFQTLKSQTASGASTPAQCSGVEIVADGSPTSSYLAAVLIASYNTNHFAGRTNCQPYSAHLQDQHLSADEQSSLITWIQNGAPNN